MICAGLCVTSASRWGSGKLKFEARIKQLVENLPDLALLVEPLLVVRRVLHTDRRPAPPLAGHRPRR